MPCGLMVTAVDGTFLRVNGTFCKWVGLSAGELLGTRKLQDLFSMGARIFHQTHWLPMLQMQGSISEVKFDVKQQGGAVLPMLFNVIRRTTESGIFDEISAVIAEDRNKYERELLAARKRADRLVTLEKDRTLFAEQMIGIVSHDLRNPLSVVMTATKVLSMGGTKLSREDADRMLSSIARAGERAQKLIDDLLDFTVARIGQGLSVTMKPIDLHEVAEKLVEEFTVAHPTRTIRHLRSGNAEVHADAHRLMQLLANLLSNALTYGDPFGTVTIISNVDRGVAQLAVHNAGPPISASALATMFEPMVRGDSDISSRSVGLGLFIVRAIAKAHGGDVSVTSASETGTRFTLTFPTAVRAA
jgi:sigma-B regulation protein RsbU (phosphoserine phosphatase)